MANETAFVIKCSAIGKLKLENVVQIHRNRVKSERTAALVMLHGVICVPIILVQHGDIRILSSPKINRYNSSDSLFSFRSNSQT